METRKFSSLTRINSPMTLTMECSSPCLDEAQIVTKSAAENEYKQFMKKFSESLVKRNAEIIEKGTTITVYELDCAPTFPVSLIPPEVSPPNIMKSTPTSTLLATSQANLITNNNVVLTNGNVTSSGTYQLVVGPRMGLIVSSANPGTVNSVPTVTNGNSTTVCKPAAPIAPRVQIRPGLSTTNNTNVQQPVKRFVSPTVTKNTTVTMPASKSTPLAISKPASTTVMPIVSSVTSVGTKNKNKSLPNSNEPTSNKTIIKANEVKTPVVDLTEDDIKATADSREVSLSRYPGKIYPSLVVVARPSLKIKEMTSSIITAERTQLDTKVKGILVNSATKFTEWLIQQGLVRSEQVCSNHTHCESEAQRKLKLGMYSDVSKFPYSGGYIWISDCCPQKFVSVFCNSIFEGAPHAPHVLLKLMYHWSCQTNVHNIISWVKVDNLYIKNFFTNLRAVCTAAVCEKFGKLGGPGKKIEVGVISLGTTSQNGNVRQVKVEVLGVMDPVTKYVRLRAVEPAVNAEKNHKQRFQRIFEALDQWVHKSTTIVTDYTVDKAALVELGFHSIVQSSLNSHAKDNNQCVMDYLKRVVPRMFQNTLSLLSKSIIQQFLDELVWRERWGPIPSRAFDNLILHLSEMTRLDSGDTLMNRLKSITLNPFRDWSYKNWRLNSVVSNHQGKRTHPVPEPTKLMIVKAKGNAVMPTHSRTGKSFLSSATSNEAGEAIPELPTIDNLPPSITEVDDDSVSISSSSSRRSRTRASGDDTKTNCSNNKQINENSVVLQPLESYYYGTVTPDVVDFNKPKNKDLNMKCFACGLTYNNNIEFMKHLAGHAQDEGAFTTDHRCRYCFKHFTSVFDLEDHEGNTHFPSKYNSMCYICLERFKKRADLITHMHSTHVELELPYQCNVCKFRSSVHTAVVDHFYKVHNRCEKVQCPFCLKVVAFESSNGNKITQNVNFFFNHLQRHQRKSIRKCSKCVLCFVNKNLLKEHQSKDHTSCVAMAGITRQLILDLSLTLMPAPPGLVSTRKGKSLSSPIPSFSTYPLSETLQYPEIPMSKCLECKMDVSNPSQHFTALFSCMKCQFSSCCKMMMTMHFKKLHEKGKRKQIQHKPAPLKKPLYCVCGFSSSCGNTMASHLVMCKRRVAYPNAERAAQYSLQMQSATFPPLVNLDDIEHDSNDPSDRWLRAFVKNSSASDGDESKTKKNFRSEPSPPRMLKELGLVRKEPEDELAKTAGPTDNCSDVPVTNVTMLKNLEPESHFLKLMKKETEKHPVEISPDEEEEIIESEFMDSRSCDKLENSSSGSKPKVNEIILPFVTKNDIESQTVVKSVFQRTTIIEKSSMTVQKGVESIENTLKSSNIASNTVESEDLNLAAEKVAAERSTITLMEWDDSVQESNKMIVD